MHMNVTPHQINSLRAVTTWGLRLLALMLLVTGAYLMLKRLVFGIGVWDFNSALQAWMGIGEDHSFYRGIAMMLVGGAVGAMSRRLAAWVVAMPPAGCPQCGYGVAPPSGSDPPDRCPECGLALRP